MPGNQWLWPIAKTNE